MLSKAISSSASSPQPLFLSCADLVANFKLGWESDCVWALENIPLLEHLWLILRQLMKHLLLLEAKPPSWLGIADKLPSLSWAAASLWVMQSCPRKGKGYLVELRKVVERDPAQGKKLKETHIPTSSSTDTYDSQWWIGTLEHNSSCIQFCLLTSFSITYLSISYQSTWLCLFCVQGFLGYTRKLHRRKSPCLVCARTRRWNFTLICIYPYGNWSDRF